MLLGKKHVLLMYLHMCYVVLFFPYRYFKDELRGNTLTHYVGLRSKAYALQIHSAEDKKLCKIKCKGIAKSYKDRLKLDNFLSCITHTAKLKTNMRTIRTRNNLLNIINQNKTAVSSFDDKRWLSCSIHSLGFGSTLINRANNYCVYCPNADTFYSDDKFANVIDVSQ